MKILTSKIVNGKKMFLIEDNDSQGRVFAQGGKPIKKENISYYNPYYVDIKGINSSDNVSTKLTPSKKITPQELKQIKESPTNVGNIALKEKQEKVQRLKEAEEAYQKRKSGAPITPELLAQETQAIGDKISLQNIPGVGQYIPDVLDITGGLGSMASNLGALPLNLNRGNYGQALLSVATPLTVGALAGIGTQNTSQFVNNVINPLAGIKLKANLPEGTVVNGISLNSLKKTPKNSFQSEIELVPTNNEFRGENSYYIKKGNELIGDFDLEKEGDKYITWNVGLNPEYRGKGLGKQAYIQANELLKNQNKGLLHSSGNFIGSQAKNVWKSLTKEGKAIQLGEDEWRFLKFGGTIKVLDTKIEKNKKYYLINE